MEQMQSGRIQLLDLSRGIALIAMTIFHFAFDLELLGIKEPGFISQPHWKYFARAIATSFLFLTGMSLLLAHGGGIRWGSWKWRLGKIVGAAALITIATYFATPDQYIFFGILHAIAFASIAGLAFLNVPVALTFVCAISIFAIGQTFESASFDHWIWWWTGLAETKISSSDFVPVFPWFSAPLLGIATAKFLQDKKLIAQLAIPTFDSRVSRAIRFIGRNSLVYYLLHQPVMITGILSVLFLTGNLNF